MLASFINTYFMQSNKDIFDAKLLQKIAAAS